MPVWSSLAHLYLLYLPALPVIPARMSLDFICAKIQYLCLYDHNWYKSLQSDADVKEYQYCVTSFPSCFISATPLSTLAVGLWGVAVYNDNNHESGLFNNIQYIQEYIGCTTGDNI